jgi:hypothetical protein
MIEREDARPAQSGGRAILRQRANICGKGRRRKIG